MSKTQEPHEYLEIDVKEATNPIIQKILEKALGIKEPESKGADYFFHEGICFHGNRRTTHRAKQTYFSNIQLSVVTKGWKESQKFVFVKDGKINITLLLTYSQS